MMKRYAPLLLIALLAACSGGGDSLTAGKNDTAPNGSALSGTPVAGNQSGLVSGDPAGNYGEAYVSNGQGYLLVSPTDNDPVTALYKLGPGSSVQRVPPTASGAAVSASFTSAATTDTATPAPTLAQLAGTYTVTAGQQQLAFTVAANGAISGGSGCTISGQINGQSSYGSALPASFTLQGCGTGVDGSYAGLALQPSADAAPALLRLVGASGTQLIDLIAY